MVSFVGREQDIIEVVRKAMNANDLNINGAPGFGKSIVAIHAGHWLFKNKDCISVRYINILGGSIIDNIVRSILEKSGYQTKPAKNGSHCYFYF